MGWWMLLTLMPLLSADPLQIKQAHLGLKLAEPGVPGHWAARGRWSAVQEGLRVSGFMNRRRITRTRPTAQVTRAAMGPLTRPTGRRAMSPSCTTGRDPHGRPA